MNFKISSPAKINLGLKVLNKRKDNFHNIKTIFQFLIGGIKFILKMKFRNRDNFKEIQHEKTLFLNCFVF